MLCARWLEAGARAAATCGSASRDRVLRLRCCAATTARWLWSLEHAPLVICLLLGVMALNVHLYIVGAEELPAQPGHRTARRLHPRRRRHVVPGDAAEDRGLPQGRARRPGGRRAWPGSSAAAAASTTRRRSSASSRSRSARSSAQVVADRIRRRRCRSWPAPACSSTPIRTSASAAGAAAARSTATRCSPTTSRLLRVWGANACGRRWPSCRS